MKPRTKLQQRVINLSQQLPEITPEQKEWAHEHCFNHLGYQIKRGITCMECGIMFQTEEKKKCTCSVCGAKLKIEKSRKKTLIDYAYFCIFTTIEEFQVIRFFEISQHCKASKSAYYHTWEIVQQWILPNGKNTIVARCASSYSYYRTGWCGGAMEIRNPQCRYRNLLEKYNIIPTAIYPQMGILPILKKYGIKGKFPNIAPLALIKRLLDTSWYGQRHIETLLKTKQYNLLNHVIQKGGIADFYWPSIKICIRNKYNVKDGSMWCDYITLLHILGKDKHNAKYVCPKNLKKVHDILVRKKEEKDRREEKERKKAKAIEQEKKFIELKSKFFGIKFSNKTIKVTVLNSVLEHVAEGAALHHCVFFSNYHMKPESLILSVETKGKKIATVELSLKTLKVVQCRGKSNSIPKEQDAIIKLIQRNIKLFQSKIYA